MELFFPSVTYLTFLDRSPNYSADVTTQSGAGQRAMEIIMTSIPESVRVWKIGVDQANVLSWNNYTNNQGYNLFCITNGKYLTWQKVPVGVNLAFKDSGDNKTHFRLPDNQEREILSGELCALGIGGSPSFLHYKERDVGI